MAYRPTSDDPFDYDKTPSLSWRDVPIGTVFTLEVTDQAKALQSTNFETGEPDFWDMERTRPKMAAVVNVLVVDGPHSVGEERSIWAQIPSNLFMALKAAQDTAGQRFAPGGTLQVRFAGEKPHDNPRFHAIKQYEARYTPPVSRPGPDPFIEEPAAPSDIQAPPRKADQWWQTSPPSPPSPPDQRPQPAARPMPPTASKAW